MTLDLQFLGDVDVEHDDSDPAAQRRTGGVIVGLQGEHEFARLEPMPTGDDGVLLRLPLALAHRTNHVLGLGPEAWADHRRHHLQPVRGDRLDVAGEDDLADIDLVGDDVDEGSQRLGVGRGDGDRGQRLADPPTMRLAHRQRRRAHVTNLVHRPHERFVARKILRQRPVGEMRRLRATLGGGAVQTGVDLLADERQQWGGDPHHHVENRVQRIDGVVVAVPEALTTAPDVPVRQRLDERPDRGAGAEQVVGVHRAGDVLDEVARFGEHVAIEHMGGERSLHPIT